MTPTAGSGPLPDDTHLGRTALCVDDVDELTTFYREVVGLEALTRASDAVTLGAGGTPLLVLESDADADGPERPSSSAGLYHNAFRVPSRAALGDALRRIRASWRLDGASDHGVSEALYLTDPAGNGVEIYRDYPREEWPRDADGTVQMTTDPLDLDDVAAAASDASQGGEADGVTDGRVPAGTDLGHVHLEVTSLDAFESFYGDALGFGLQASVRGARFVGAGGYHHHVGANTWQGRTDPAAGSALAWFEVVVPGPSDLEALQSRLAEGDVSREETDDGFAVADPDGIRIRFRTER